MKDKEKAVSIIETELTKNIDEYCLNENEAVASVVEISRTSGLQPFQVYTLLKTEKIKVNDKVALLQEIDAEKSIKYSRELSRNLSEIRSERQRYQRRFQFPINPRSRTTKEKAVKRTKYDQLLKTKIKLEPQPKTKTTKNLRRLARFSFTKTKTNEGKMQIDKRSEQITDYPIPGISIVKPRLADYYANSLKDCMKKTMYWKEKTMRQDISPDLICFDAELLEQLQEVTKLQNVFLRNILKQYISDLNSEKLSPLSSFIEKGSVDKNTLELFRKWIRTVPEDDPINYFRLDLGLSSQGNKTKLYYIETNIMTAGAAPAIIWKKAQQNIATDMGLEPVAEGSDVFFVNQIINTGNEESTFAIVANTPTNRNLRLYENSSRDMAEIISSYGVSATYSRLEDLKIRNNRLYAPDQNKPITSIFWRIRQFPTSELETLQGKLLLQLYLDKKILIYPKPCIPIFNNKNLDAIVWNSSFQEYVPEKLKEFVPRSEILNPESILFRDIIDNRSDYQKYILKSSLGSGGQGILIGKQEKESVFVREMIRKAKNEPNSNIIQEFIEPTPIPLRVRKKSGGWTNKRFYLRIEPTIGSKSNNNTTITDLMVTGRYDTYKVAGGGTAIMSTIYKKP